MMACRGTLTLENGACANARPSSLMGNLTSQDATMFWILKSCRGTEELGPHPNFYVERWKGFNKKF